MSDPGWQLRSSRKLLALPSLLVVAALLLVPLAVLLAPVLDFVRPATADAMPSPRDAFDAAWVQALAVQAGYTLAALAIELPLGLLLGLALPRRGVVAALTVAAIAWPLLLPEPVFALARTEFVPRLVDATDAALGLGLARSAGRAEVVHWAGWILVDAWRWTPLVALLCGFALRRDPRLEQAARLDGLSALQRVRFVHWPGARRALALAAVLRIADSFAAWSLDGRGVALGSWVRARVDEAPGASAALLVAVTLLVLLFLPMPLSTSRPEEP